MGIAFPMTRIKNGYRAKLLRNKLRTFMPRNHVPAPFVYLLKLSTVLLVTTALVSRAYKELCAEYARSKEEERVVRTFTKIHVIHTSTYADSLVSKKEESREFRLS